MDLAYLKNKPEMTQVVWETMENLQDIYPHYWLGWNGFVLMVYWI